MKGGIKGRYSVAVELDRCEMGAMMQGRMAAVHVRVCVMGVCLFCAWVYL